MAPFGLILASALAAPVPIDRLADLEAACQGPSAETLRFPLDPRRMPLRPASQAEPLAPHRPFLALGGRVQIYLADPGTLAWRGRGDAAAARAALAARGARAWLVGRLDPGDLPACFGYPRAEHWTAHVRLDALVLLDGDGTPRGRFVPAPPRARPPAGGSIEVALRCGVRCASSPEALEAALAPLRALLRSCVAETHAGTMAFEVERGADGRARVRSVVSTLPEGPKTCSEAALTDLRLPKGAATILIEVRVDPMEAPRGSSPAAPPSKEA